MTGQIWVKFFLLSWVLISKKSLLPFLEYWLYYLKNTKNLKSLSQICRPILITGVELNRVNFADLFVFSHEELKPDLQNVIALGGKMYTPYCLLKHCVRQCWQNKNQEYSEIIKRCKPIHTLAVCSPESEAYQRALVEYFQNASEKRVVM